MRSRLLCPFACSPEGGRSTSAVSISSVSTFSLFLVDWMVLKTISQMCLLPLLFTLLFSPMKWSSQPVATSMGWIRASERALLSIRTQNELTSTIWQHFLWYNRFHMFAHAVQTLSACQFYSPDIIWVHLCFHLYMSDWFCHKMWTCEVVLMYLNYSYGCLEISVVCSGVKESDDEDEEEENNTSPVKRPSNMTLAKVPQVISLNR